ncbi:MAG: tyrosine-type recombinase/integrase, partial [Thermoplasmata archaeon]|nr:tyrosine-type recombinase/integrase [Thermoplasmata archaeon]
DFRRDLPKLPKTRRRETPSDEVVRKWAERMTTETDVHMRLEWLLIAQTGWRPQHLCKVRWKHVRYDGEGRPTAIVASGSECDFKTDSQIAVRLPSDLQKALVEWSSVCSGVSLDDPILPYRTTSGRIDSKREQDNRILRRRWEHLRKKYGLPQLRPCDMRHFVSSACRKAGLSKQASAILQGHDSSQGDCMRDWYDNCPLTDLLEEQAQCLPDGPLGSVLKPKVELTEGLSPEIVSVVTEYLAGRVGTMDFASRMESLRFKSLPLVAER